MVVKRFDLVLSVLLLQAAPSFAQDSSPRAMLDKLAAEEAALLASGANQPRTAATSHADTLTLEQRLREANDQKRTLERQQEKLLNEILKLRKKLKTVESATPVLGETERSEREAALEDELKKERNRANKLEQDIDELRSSGKESMREKRKLDDLENELSGQRKIIENKEKQIAELTQAVELAKGDSANSKGLANTLAKTKNRAEQLELALEARKSLESDNQFLRGERTRLERELEKAKRAPASDDQQAKLLKVVDTLKQAVAHNESLGKEIETLKTELAEKSKTAAGVQSTTRELDKVRAELALVQGEVAKEKDAKRQLQDKAAASDAAAQELLSVRKQADSLQAEIELQRGELAKQVEARRIAEEKVQQFEQSKDAGQVAQKEIEKQLQEKSTQLTGKDEEILELKRQLSQTTEEVRVCSTSLDSSKSEAAGVAPLKEELQRKATELSSCSSNLESQKNAVARMQELERELVQTRNELLLYQAEAKAMGTTANSTGVQVADKAAAASPQARQLRARAARQAMIDRGKLAAREEATIQTTGVQPPVVQPPVVQAVQAQATSDVMLLEVRGSKVNLRSGPGEEHSPVMQVQQGARLTAETRTGDWYRVFTPTGGRAFIHKDTVAVADASIPTPPAPVAQAPLGSGPGKPAARAIRENTDLAPFGNVKVAGSNRPADIESVAIERLRSGLGSSGSEVAIPSGEGE